MNNNARAKFCPSLMCVDLLNAREQLAVVSRRADVGHLDIMDGHFAPNLALSPADAGAFRRACTLPLEAHLMTTEPERWIDAFAEAGVSEITLHAETIQSNAFRLIRRIEALGISPGIALCPASAVDVAEYLLERARILTIMTVDVGYSGQAFIWEMLRKIERAREFRSIRGYSYEIQIDGGCAAGTFRALREAGADRFVMGNALFAGADGLDASFDRVYAQYREATGEDAG